MSEEIKIFPNEIVIGNKSFFGLDNDLVNLVERLTIDKLNAELKRDKYKTTLDKIKEYTNTLLFELNRGKEFEKWEEILNPILYLLEEIK